TTVPGGTYEDNWFPVTPDEVFDVAANVYNTANNTGRFGLHFQDKAGNNLDWLSPASPAAGAWAAVAGQVKAPTGAWRARAWLTAGSGGNNIRITQPDIRRQGATAGANSKALSLIDATVAQQGDKITSQGRAITDLQSSVAGKAEASALSALTTTVTQQGDAISSQGTAITAVNAKIGDVPGNIVRKADFSDGMLGTWINAVVADAPASGWGSQPATTYQGRYITTTSGGTYEQSWTPCSPGDVYEVSGNLFNTVNNSGGFGLHFQTASGANQFSDLVRPADVGAWQARTARITVPAGAVRMRPWLSPGTDSNIRVTQPRIVKQSATAAEAASAVQLLDARVDLNEQGVAQARATWGVYLTAGNVISGVQSINNGIVAEFNVMAHVFRLLSPAGADGMEIQDGYIRIWKGNSQTIIGNRFGVAGQGLMKWFGPNIGAAACTKANATSWEDDQGNAYFGGSLSAGVLRNGAQSTQVGATATVETGIFTTLGRAKSVTFSLSYTNIFTTASNLGGSAALSATIILERSIDGGAWVEISRRPVTGNRVFDGYEPGVGYGYSFNIGGSSTYTDNTAGSSPTFNYRVRLADVVGWPYQRPEGGIGSLGRQSLTILSIEQ
ncbi:MAG: hypothetical protein J0H45_06435, partial [Stenotrophomonas nitritireducens]|nr:hypothetical protein [Stenotrophomonas nitritireducens]